MHGRYLSALSHPGAPVGPVWFQSSGCSFLVRGRGRSFVEFVGFREIRSA
jgi:hypothetical protein